ncbi:MAG: RHS repeat-associated core domain-containing protein, partial [SAR324 cluster bacterium]|nr:RHS repeat-associated core domain-containing protein [SAR324 cluster bacterium]
NLEIKRLKSVTNDHSTTILDRQSLHVMDGETCVAITNYWVKDDLNRETDKTGERRFRYQLDNNLGSSCVEVDEHANTISYEEYFPYGGTSIIAGHNQREVKRKDYRYCGKERDDSTGLYYYGARYYAPWMGRWMNPDPAGTVDGMNLCAFVRGNPVTFHDPNGLTRDQKVSDTKQQLLSDAHNAITSARGNVPYAGNVKADVDTTKAESTARLNVARHILNHQFGETDEVIGAINAINRAASAICAHGGACNEFSALTHSELISHATTQPIIRVWDLAATHSFTLIGDPRALSASDVIVADAWPSQYQAATLEDTRWNSEIGAGRLKELTRTPLVGAAQAGQYAVDLQTAIGNVPAGSSLMPMKPGRRCAGSTTFLEGCSA